MQNQITGLKAGSLLGKCSFCSGKIVSEHRSVSSKFALIHNAKWICGDCILGMQPTVSALAKDAKNYINMMEAANIETEVDFVVDWKTGKLIKVKK